jgi:hypothetical protein
LTNFPAPDRIKTTKLNLFAAKGDRLMPPKPLLSGLPWRIAAATAALLLLLAMLYTAVQLIAVFNTGIRFS